MIEWFYNKDGQQVGPVDQNQLVALITTEELAANTYIWTDGMAEWEVVSQSPFAKFTKSNSKTMNSPASTISQQQDATYKDNGKKPIGAVSVRQVETKLDAESKNIENKSTYPETGGFMENRQEQDMKTPKPYVHSGKYPSNATFLVPIISMLPLLIIAPIYAAGIFYIPFIYLNFILIAGYGLAVGIIVQVVGKMFKVRHAKLQNIFAVIVSAFAIYLAWLFWIKFLTGIFIVSPFSMLPAISFIAEKGTWGMGKDATVSGNLLYIFWLAEAGAVVFFSVLLSKIDVPFCERCDEWVETAESISPLSACSNSPSLAQSIMTGNFEVLRALELLELGSDHYTIVTLTSCLACSKMHLLSVVDVVETPNEKGDEVVTTETDIVKNILIDYEDHKILKNNWK